ncbi:M28 family peptidase [Clostridium sp.]|uniref:M28 family peptidase n=1 Tax=Clostridium sp. TaxID=1506 RepID=UPI0034649A09
MRKIKINQKVTLLVLTLTLFFTLGLESIREVRDHNTIRTYIEKKSNVENEIKDILTTLTNDKYEGRLAGNNGNKLAEKYMEKNFKDNGLEPYFKDNYYHSYNQIVYLNNESNHYMKVSFKDNTSKEYVYGKDYMDLSRNNELNLKGKITFDEKRTSENLIGVLDESNENLGGLIMGFKGAFLKKEVFEGYVRIGTGVKPIFQISPEMYEELKTREASNVEIKSSYKVENKKVNNVIGRIRGESSKEAIVISAHFDHVGKDGETIFKGAVDNSSGTSVLLALAKELSNISKENKFKKDIVFCAFNGEEQGLIGSREFVPVLKKDYEKLYNINIDCVGKKDGENLLLAGIKNHEHDFVKTMEKYLEKNKLDFKTKDMEGASDHSSFIDNHIFGVTLGQENMFKGTRIHSAKDDEDLIDYDYIVRVYSSILEFILENSHKNFTLE